jgi:hypothetical protein
MHQWCLWQSAVEFRNFTQLQLECLHWPWSLPQNFLISVLRLCVWIVFVNCIFQKPHNKYSHGLRSEENGGHDHLYPNYSRKWLGSVLKMLIKHIQHYICNVWLKPILLKKTCLQNSHPFLGERTKFLEDMDIKISIHTRDSTLSQDTKYNDL